MLRRGVRVAEAVQPPRIAGRPALSASLAALLLFAGGAEAAERETTLVSRQSETGLPGSTQAANGHSSAPSISADGRYVAFVSEADNLSNQDADGVTNVYVRDVQTNTTTLVSKLVSGPLVVAANGDSWEPAISSDGRYVAYTSVARNLSDEDSDGFDLTGTPDVFLHDLQTGATTLVSRASAGALSDGVAANGASGAPDVSANGQVVAFSSEATNLGGAVGPTDVFVRNIGARTTTLVSRATGGANADDDSGAPSISSDGRYVAFESDAGNLGEDSSFGSNVFRRDLVANTTLLVSRFVNNGTVFASGGANPSISADGTRIAFEDEGDIILRDIPADSRELVNLTGVENGDLTPAISSSTNPAISADGTKVAFESQASEFGPANGPSTLDVFVRNIQMGTTTLISRQSAGAGGAAADAHSRAAAVSADGRLVAFASEADNLSTIDSDLVADVFLREPGRTAPSKPSLIGAPAARIADSTPTFRFSGAVGNRFTCRFDDRRFSRCDAAGEHSAWPVLEDGQHTFEVQAVSDEGVREFTGAKHSFTVDTTAPSATVVSGPDGFTQNRRPSFGWERQSSPGDLTIRYECRFDAGAWGACSALHSHQPAADLPDGVHTFAVRAIDDLGNTQEPPSTRSFTVDTLAPDTAIDSGPQGTTTSSTVRFEFSSSDPFATFECRVDGAEFGPCQPDPDGAHQVTLAPGEHTFEVRSKDRAGNIDVSPASRTFQIVVPDTTPPQTTIETGPAGLTPETRPTFAFSASEAGSTFECRFDEAAFGPCSGPGLHAPTLALEDGPHTFQVRAKDPAGNTDPTPASRSFEVDATRPALEWLKVPKKVIRTKAKQKKAAASFGLRASEAVSYECRLNGRPAPACGEAFKLRVGRGRNVVIVDAVDAAGNEAASLSYSFRVKPKKRKRR